MEIGRYGMGSRRRLGNGVGSVNASVGTTKLGIDIPEWLLMELLIRLPVKLVFRCKLVSKKWLSIILDPYLIGMYVLRASMSPQSQTWTFIYKVMHEDDGPLYDLLEDVYLRDLKCPSLYQLRCPTYPIFEKYCIAGVSNGLLLYIPCERLFRPNNIFNICNPVTRQWISLPPYVRSFKHDRVGFVTNVENSVLSSYRVVRLDMPFERRNIIRFEVFVSEINEWKGVDVYTDQSIEVTNRIPCALNGILHWVTMEHGIIAYDPYHKLDSLRFIALPRDIDPTRNSIRHGIRSLCDAHQGNLRYFEVSGVCMNPIQFSGMGVWMLNDYSSGDWCLQHRISANDILDGDILSGKHFLPQPLSFHPFDTEILFLGFGRTIISYNIKTRKLKSHGRPVDSLDSSWWWTYSFVIPPWPTSIAPSFFGVC